MAIRKKKRKKETKQNLIKTNRIRIKIIFYLVMACIGLLLVRLIEIKVKHGESYERNALTLQSSDSVSIPYKRGDIFDRNGNVLATSEKIYRLIIDPKGIQDSKIDNIKIKIATVLEEYFDIEPNTSNELFKKENTQYLIVKEALSYEDVEKYLKLQASKDEQDKKLLKEIGINLYLEEYYKRVYPYKTLACDLIGFIRNSSDDVQYGLEYYYNDILSGVNGRKYGYLDSDINMQTVVREPQNGYTLVSTIDLNIQRITDKYIAEFMNEKGAKNVAAIVMDPDTAEILAMSNAPFYDLNNPGDLSHIEVTQDDYNRTEYKNMTENEILSDKLINTWNNYCIENSFEPGSTVKTMTVAYALDQNVIQTDDEFYCDGGQTYTSDQSYVSCNAEHDMLNLKETLMYSCNDAMMQISDKLGKNSFINMQKLFNIGQLTGIDLPREADCSGRIFTEETMGPIELWTSSFGQGYYVNMMQVITAFSSIINNGHYYEPKVVTEVKTEKGETIEKKERILVKNTVSEQTSRYIREALYDTVENGTAQAAKVDGYAIGGKTGTAEKFPRSENKRLVSFIGFAPVEDPELVVYVIVDEANDEDQGQSSFASNIASKIFAEALPYMQIFPEETEIILEE